MRQDTFREFHPAVGFIYFTLVLGFAMTLKHPVSQLAAFVCAMLYALQTEGGKAVRLSLKFSLPLLLLTALINPAFNHSGVTVLLYLPTGNPLTLESILYGLSAGVMFATVLTWFLSFNRVMTGGRLIYLFGRIIPALSLVLSMTLRLVPRFRGQLEAVREAQKCVGRGISGGKILCRLRNAAAVLSAMVTWSLEDAAWTADSMRSRGYGQKGRTAFSVYRIDRRDIAALIYMLCCGIYVIYGCIANGFDFRFFPDVRGAAASAFTVSLQAVYLMLCIMPVVINEREARRWTALRSKI